jgi:hypothetical protein
MGKILQFGNSATDGDGVRIDEGDKVGLLDRLGVGVENEEGVGMGVGATVDVAIGVGVGVG